MLAVADARAKEGTDSAIAFAVTLDRAARRTATCARPPVCSLSGHEPGGAPAGAAGDGMASRGVDFGLHVTDGQVRLVDVIGEGVVVRPFLLGLDPHVVGARLEGGYIPALTLLHTA